MTITCPKCSYTRQPTDTAPDYACPSCGIVYAKFDAKADLEDRLRLAMKTGNWSRVPPEHIPEQVKAQLQRQALVLTTTPTVPGREISCVVDIVAAECAYGMNAIKDFLATVTDVAGGRSGSTQQVLRDARRTVMAELRNEAFNLGADAVVGVDVAVSEFSGGGKSMLFMVATGTAVKLVPR
jgi:uncharacterized protein YbjQ (UPF0145 family)